MYLSQFFFVCRMSAALDMSGQKGKGNFYLG